MNKTRWYSQLTLVLVLAFALKLHYSLASPDQLRWILAPTTALVEFVSGTRFHFESFAGYLSSDRRFLIAASCAGVNFLIASFLMLALRHLWKNKNAKTSWSFIPLSAACAFATTLVANTVRIALALWMQRTSFEASWLSRDQIHRLEGIVVYFAFLLALFLFTETASQSRSSTSKLLLFPVVIYYLITLLVPFASLLMGRGSDGTGLGEHSLVVLLVPLMFVAPVALYRRFRAQRNA